MTVIMEYCGNITLPTPLENDFDPETLATMYLYFCPIIIAACLFSVILNGILIKVRGSRLINNLPILTLSLNLAATDAMASSITVLCIVFSSYLPVVKGIQLNKCFLLTLEVLRLTSLFASVLHLMALTWLHYQGTVNPIDHRLTSLYQRSENIKYVSLTCWMVPFIIFILIFSSTPCQGYRSEECDFTFLYGWQFRSIILILFGSPWLIMILAYLHIFWALEVAHNLAFNRTESGSDNQCTNNSRRVESSGTYQNSYRKAITTSLIIIATYLIGWMPAVIWFAISCVDGCPYPVSAVSFKTRACLGFITTALVVAKPIIDPLIYSYRHKEVRLAIVELFCRQSVRFHSGNENTLYSFTNRVHRTNEEEMVTVS